LEFDETFTICCPTSLRLETDNTDDEVEVETPTPVTSPFAAEELGDKTDGVHADEEEEELLSNISRPWP